MTRSQPEAKGPVPVRAWHMIKTYRYLRVGMIGAVVLLGISLVIEVMRTDCWQTSISAYYYTPVRPILVGSLIAVGALLIIYKGRGLLEDAFLNLAGMLITVVAVVPTSSPDQPGPCPLENALPSIDNNFRALLISGLLAWVFSLIVTIGAVRTAKQLGDRPDKGTWWAVGVTLSVTPVVLLLGWWAFRYWDGFDEFAHGWAAVGFFASLIAAIISYVVEQWRNYRQGLQDSGRQGSVGTGERTEGGESDEATADVRGRRVGWRVKYVVTGWRVTYVVTAVLMILGVVFFWYFLDHYRYHILLAEGWGIVTFGAYWSLQTWENWNYEYGLGWQRIETSQLIQPKDIKDPYKLEGGEERLKDVAVSEILSLFKKLEKENPGRYDRVVVWDGDAGGRVFAVFHRAALQEAYIRRLTEPGPGRVSTVLDNWTVGDLVEADYRTFENNGLKVVRRHATLDEAVRMIEFPCRDVFVTAHGQPDEPIIGWLTDHEIGGISRL